MRKLCQASGVSCVGPFWPTWQHYTPMRPQSIPKNVPPLLSLHENSLNYSRYFRWLISRRNILYADWELLHWIFNGWRNEAENPTKLTKIRREIAVLSRLKDNRTGAREIDPFDLFHSPRAFQSTIEAKNQKSIKRVFGVLGNFWTWPSADGDVRQKALIKLENCSTKYPSLWALHLTINCGLMFQTFMKLKILKEIFG